MVLRVARSDRDDEKVLTLRVLFLTTQRVLSIIPEVRNSIHSPGFQEYSGSCLDCHKKCSFVKQAPCVNDELDRSGTTSMPSVGVSRPNYLGWWT